MPRSRLSPTQTDLLAAILAADTVHICELHRRLQALPAFQHRTAPGLRIMVKCMVQYGWLEVLPKSPVSISGRTYWIIKYRVSTHGRHVLQTGDWSRPPANS